MEKCQYPKITKTVYFVRTYKADKISKLIIKKRVRVLSMDLR